MKKFTERKIQGPEISTEVCGMSNITFTQVGELYAIKADTEKFGQQEIMYTGSSLSDCTRWLRSQLVLAMTYGATDTNTTEDLIYAMIECLPEAKQRTVRNVISKAANKSWDLVAGIEITMNGAAYISAEYSMYRFTIYCSKNGEVRNKPRNDLVIERRGWGTI